MNIKKMYNNFFMYNMNKIYFWINKQILIKLNNIYINNSIIIIGINGYIKTKTF